VSGAALERGVLAVGGVPADRALAALRRLEPHARAFHLIDLDRIESRARAFTSAFPSLDLLPVYAAKANGLPAILECLRAADLGGEAGSLGELHLLSAAGFAPGRSVLNGNGRTPEEAAWAAAHGVGLVNADLVEELDLLDRCASEAGTRLRVALRVNPGVGAAVHRYISTGDDDAKFGVSPGEALDAWAARGRWPGLVLDGVHVHVGSQLMDTTAHEAVLEVALGLAAESASRGAPLALVNLGGGFGVDYSGAGAEFPLALWGRRLAERAEATRFRWVMEPGRWMVADAGVLIAEVLWVKHRSGKRFVVLAAGMNDFLRSALYQARHRIVAVRPRPGSIEPASVVGPVCESADVFAADVPLPPLQRGDLVALLDTGAYGAAMSSNYNGRGRLAELVVRGGRLTRARAGEGAEEMASRVRSDLLME